MDNKPNVTLELRLSNTVFKCAFDAKFYNVKNKKAYALQQVMGIAPDMQNTGRFQIAVDSLIICEDCWEKNKSDEPDSLCLSEPSNIVIPKSNVLPKLNNKRVN